MTDIIQKILSYAEHRNKPRFLLAIDGRCGAGKTTLAGELARYGWSVFHMDDFFLPPPMRTPERLALPGGNVDHERFRYEILIPLVSGAKEITYRPFDCTASSFGLPITVKAGKKCVIEGSYSCHPNLWESYDMRVFVTTDPVARDERIKARCIAEGAPHKAEIFRTEWIPLEEQYFSAYDVEGNCDIVYRT